MSLSGELLASFVTYGLPVLFGVVMLGSAGLPVPGVVLVIAAGALVRLGEMNFWLVLGLSCSAAILGDNIGYAIGRYGGRRLALRVFARLGGQSRLHQVETLAGKWGGPGIFLSRWLITPVGALFNLIFGMTGYSYRRFLFFDVAGEILWAIEYVFLGELLSDRIPALMELVDEAPWVVLGLVGAIIFGVAILRRLRKVPA